jgi:hypothetical protein
MVSAANEICLPAATDFPVTATTRRGQAEGAPRCLHATVPAWSQAMNATPALIGSGPIGRVMRVEVVGAGEAAFG